MINLSRKQRIIKPVIIIFICAISSSLFSDITRELLCAVHSNDFKYAETLIQNGNYSRIPLHTAALAGSSDIIRLLLDYGADPDALYLNGHAASEIALKNRNAEAALLLFSYKNYVSDKLYEMYQAIYDNDVVHIKQLLDQGFEIK
jgi:ankyrin repeat protein